MKNRGFTLIELLAVIILISLISLIVFPVVMSAVNKNKPKLQAGTERLIYNATDLYLDANQTNYIKGDDAVYCPTVQDLIDNGFLDEKLIDINSGDEYSGDLIIKSEYRNHKYNYTIVKSGCTESYPDTSKAYIVIGDLTFSRKKIYSNVETNITIPITTNKINDGTQLELKVRKGSKYVDGFTKSGGKVNNNASEFEITVPKSAKVGEYVIEITGGKAPKATKNFRVYMNPIILFMGD